MTTFNTRNRLGSNSPKDLYDNAENLDNGINGTAKTWTDRFGVTRKSWNGIETDFQQFLADGSTIEFASWAEANIAVGNGQIPLNRQVAVVGDYGTHTDPVTGQVVPNSGRYIMTVVGLQFRSADVLTQKADKSEVAEVAGIPVDRLQGILEAHCDPATGRVAKMLLEDGTEEFFAGIRVGGLNVTRVSDSTASIVGTLDWHGSYTEWSAELQGDLAGALAIDVDAFGRIGRVLYADGSSWPKSGPPDPTKFVLIEQISLPNGAQGQNANGGFTCTGLALITTGKWRGCWVAGNDGRAYEGTNGGSSAPFLCSIVVLTPDLRRIVREIPCNTASFPGIQSIQGVAWDSSDDTIWFVDKTNKTLRHITFDGAKLTDEIVVTHTTNGLAYRADLDALYTPNEGGNQVYLVACATGAILTTLTGMSPVADQLHYQASTKRLWATIGNNGVDGQALVYNAETMAQIAAYPLPGSQAIEGIHFDETAKVLTTLNDGAFHGAANPPLALACKYRFE